MEILLSLFQLQTALKQYVLHNTGHFDPVEFEVVDEQNDTVILTAQFQPEEFIVFEGTKQVLSIFLAGLFLFLAGGIFIDGDDFCVRISCSGFKAWF